MTQLAEMTGFSTANISQRLNGAGLEPAEMRAKSKVYDCRAALRALYKGGAADANVERAKLDSVRTESAEFDLAVKRGEYVKVEALDQALVAAIAPVTVGMRSLGATLGPLLAIESSPVRCKEIVEDGVRAALEELISIGGAAYERVRAGAGLSVRGAEPRPGGVRARKARPRVDAVPAAADGAGVGAGVP